MYLYQYLVKKIINLFQYMMLLRPRADHSNYMYIEVVTSRAWFNILFSNCFRIHSRRCRSSDGKTIWK